MSDTTIDEQATTVSPIPVRLPPIVQPSVPTTVQLPPSTLGGAIGCDFRGGLDQLLFVEYSGNLSRMNLNPSPSYAVLGTGYTEPEDVKASADGVHAYVTERSGDLVKVDLSSANRSSATVVASGMTAPQQLFLDEGNNAAYTVEYAPSGKLWRIDLLNNTKTAVLSGLQNAVGVVLSADRQSAYIVEQMTGAADGRISCFQLSSGSRQTVVTGLTAPFFLTWLDTADTTLLVPERDPVNRLRSVNVAAGTSVIVAQGLPAQPSSTAMVSAATVLVCCNNVIDEIYLQPAPNQVGGPLLESIGWVPYDWVTASGLADTISHSPNYVYAVHDAPFGGTLPVMVNFAEAASLGASYYQVQVDGVPRTDTFNGAQWNGTEYVAATFSPVTLNGDPGYYPVLTPAQVESWAFALPGCYLDSTNLRSGETHTITVELFNATGGDVAGPTSPLPSMSIYVDNSPCTAQMSAATLAGTAATPCGFLNYTTTETNVDVDVPFLAAQPDGYATFSLGVTRGVTGITGAFPSGTSGTVTATPTWSSVEATVESLLTYDGGTPPCTTAAFAVYLGVYAMAQNGQGRCGQYDASAAQAFMLAPAS